MSTATAVRVHRHCYARPPALFITSPLLQLLMGKRKLNESDSDCSDDSDVEGKMEKSDLLNDQNESESTKVDGSLGSVTSAGGTFGSGSCESGLRGREGNCCTRKSGICWVVE
ncbi:hypothetical protein DEO72_LG2g4297 [Vigna unguiculata]|uniref:Uncharacterized protein n=1 Tax=Vigna unguiculata TaxID=3917 RepID=A0A4D6L625_VIGUN|nr:hypothetical protein DEO72_LG2g4297 [Vigna unguiculata]